MNLFHSTLIALTLGSLGVACGGSDTPVKDPSTDTPATMPSSPEQTPDPPAATAAPSAASSAPAPAAAP